jgi:hypothetical protein
MGLFQKKICPPARVSQPEIELPDQIVVVELVGGAAWKAALVGFGSRGLQCRDGAVSQHGGFR